MIDPTEYGDTYCGVFNICNKYVPATLPAKLNAGVNVMGRGRADTGGGVTPLAGMAVGTAVPGFPHGPSASVGSMCCLSPIPKGNETPKVGNDAAKA